MANQEMIKKYPGLWTQEDADKFCKIWNELEKKNPISQSRTQSREKCSCGGLMYDGHDKKLNQWFTECIECGLKRYPNLLRGIF